MSLKPLEWPGRRSAAPAQGPPAAGAAVAAPVPGIAVRQDEKGFPWIAVLPLALIPLFGNSAGGVDRLLLLMEGAFLLIGVRRPVWILGAVVVSEFTIGNYMFLFGSFQISSRLLIAMAAVPLVAPHIIRRPDLGPATRGMLVMAIAFVAVATLANSVYADGAYVFQFLRYIVTGVTVLALVPAVIQNRDDLRDLGILALTIASASAIAAVLQHYHYKGAPIYQAVPHPGAIFNSFQSWEGRSLGLTESPVYLSNQLMVAAMFVLGVLLFANLRTGGRRLLLAILVLLALGLYLTYTRSWAYSAAIALLPMVILYRGRYSREFWILAILAAAVFLYYSDYQGSRYTLGPGDEESAAARPVLWSAGLNIAMDHPFLGVGHNRFLELSPEYASAPDTADGEGSVLGVYTPHNDFLNIWLSFGIVALFLYLGIVVLAIKNFVEAYFRASDPLLKGIALGGMAAVIAFETNSFFHNYFDSTLSLWLLAGLSLAVVKLINLRTPWEAR